MKEKDLDGMIDNLRCCELPDCPNNIEDNVLRKVRLQSEESLKFLPWLNDCLGQVKLLVPALGLAAVVSVFVTIISVNAINGDRKFQASHALGFDVITESSTFEWDN